MVRDLGKWRPGFYTEFRCASHEHSGLPWGAIFEKLFRIRKYTLFENGYVPKFQKSPFFPGQKPRRVRQDIEELFRLTEYGH